jgi:hypothetical protein
MHVQALFCRKWNYRSRDFILYAYQWSKGSSKLKLRDYQKKVSLSSVYAGTPSVDGSRRLRCDTAA